MSEHSCSWIASNRIFSILEQQNIEKYTKIVFFFETSLQPPWYIHIYTQLTAPKIRFLSHTLFKDQEISILSSSQTRLWIPITLWPIAFCHLTWQNNFDDFLASWFRELSDGMYMIWYEWFCSNIVSRYYTLINVHLDVQIPMLCFHKHKKWGEHIHSDILLKALLNF